MKKSLRIIMIVILFLTYNIQAQGTLETAVEYHNENPPKTYKKSKISFSEKISKVRESVKNKVKNIHLDKKKLKVGSKRILKGTTKLLKAKQTLQKKALKKGANLVKSKFFK